MNKQAAPSAWPGDQHFQDELLVGVSRTFALTIPQLPASLRGVVTNAYLLCRIADTIEDDPGIAPAEKTAFHQRFVEALEGRTDARMFARDLEGRLSAAATHSERALIRNTGRVVDATRGFSEDIQAILKHRVAVMCRGMPLFQHHPPRCGLRNLDAMDRYCYYVAGVVGEMLTELFCLQSPAVDRHREPLFELAASFGQGLQMTNILKDVWEDLDRGVCWLPQDVFAIYGYDLDGLHPEYNRTAFTPGLRTLLGVAHGHLRNALRYTLHIPSREAGMRRFCLWSLVLAALTLRRISVKPGYTSGNQVKVSRATVQRTLRVIHAVSRSDLLIRALFAWSAHGLPLAREVTTYPAFSQPALRIQ